MQIFEDTYSSAHGHVRLSHGYSHVASSTVFGIWKVGVTSGVSISVLFDNVLLITCLMALALNVCLVWHL